ncbi:hypothetical protein Halxa_0053 (plasmid) [Halopiger xanaduensis SH-6]|uniref:Uncharacterized protein n=1 Tax=Halopiger xanaduensis (strain DSM 18323 / JCM 14033 / SH-6) TaxID=797210 RepID=F8DE29_HALXS|nr:hypothetical protein Halxa_0053 [Halopiger xanaduensis SH-6]
MNFDQTTQALIDSDVWTDVEMVANGYLTPYLVDTATGTMLPFKVFGIGGMALGEMVVNNRAFILGSGPFVVPRMCVFGDNTELELPTASTAQKRSSTTRNRTGNSRQNPASGARIGGTCRGRRDHDWRSPAWICCRLPVQSRPETRLDGYTAGTRRSIEHVADNDSVT